MNEELQDLLDDYSDMITAGRTPEAAEARLRKRRVPDAVVAQVAQAWAESVGKIIVLRDPEYLESDGRVRWYPGPQADDRFWPGVRARLRRSLGEADVQSVDDASSKILGLMDPPGAETIHTRGLVLGHVQSGKTTSFLSVAAKAADRGYKLIIVLSGVTDNLRFQTQSRLQEVLVGDGAQNWHLLTTTDSDFAGSGNAANLLSQPHVVLAVVKKNPHRLRRVRDWLRQAGEATLRNTPILLIDDEADQASINVGAGRVSTINGLIRQILDHPKAAYLAYTATPFANVFIDPTNPRDLYPKDFIVALSRPPAYWGAERIFGRDPLDEDEAQNPDVQTTGLDVVRPISSSEAEASRPPRGRGAVYSWDPTMPAQLERALLWFVLSTAARRVRDGRDKHSSMLVHTSMLAEGHRRLAVPVQDRLDHWVGARDSGADAFRTLAEELWDYETTRLPAPLVGQQKVDFSEVWDQLPDTLRRTRIVMDNYLAQAQDRLAYPDDDPQTVVVIGGNTLSRGLTLEGLVCSYFVRSATAYDTLLQMGRWFGYRAGYEDLVRIWMTDELGNWFRDLAQVEAELRTEVSRYSELGRNPDQLAVRVRTHPSMEIVAKAKMGAAQQLNASYSTGKPQTRLFFHRDREWLDANIDACRRLVNLALDSGGQERAFRSGFRGLAGVPVAAIRGFLSEYAVHPATTGFRSAEMARYIQRENAAGALLNWNVVFPTREAQGGIDLGLSAPLKVINRSRLADGVQDRVSIGFLTSITDRIADLTPDIGSVPTSVKGFDDGQLNQLREQYLRGVGLLCIYPIDKDSTFTGERGLRERAGLEAVQHVIGVSVYFPEAFDQTNTVEYMSVRIDPGDIEDAADEFMDIEKADLADEQVGAD